MTGQTLKMQVESMFDVVKSRSSGDELVFVCPVPGCGDQSGNRSVNLKNGRTNCWRCNTGGDFVKWARWLGYAVEDDSTPLLSMEELFKLLDPPRPASVIPVISEINLPPDFHSCYDYPDSTVTKQIAAMAKRKNLDPEDLFNAGVGYTTANSSWAWYSIFPVLEFNRLVYFQGRTFWDEPGASTKKFPNRTEAPLSSKYWIYNIDVVNRAGVDTVIVVESILNVLSLEKKLKQLGVNNMVPVCVFKHSVSKTQFLKLMRFKNIKEVILLFDFDAIDLSWNDAKRIDDLLRVSIAEMPYVEGSPKIDANDDVDAAWRAIEKRKPFSMLGSLQRRLSAIGSYFYSPDISPLFFDLHHATTEFYPDRKCLHNESGSCSHDSEAIQRKSGSQDGDRGAGGNPSTTGEPGNEVRDGRNHCYR